MEIDKIKKLENDRLTEQIIGCAYRVGNGLGSGFLEKVYENALVVELEKDGLKIKRQYPITIRYQNKVVGEYVADLLAEDRVLIELKAVEKLSPIHSAQCLNYLKATGLPVCLLMNFGEPKVKIRRLTHHF